MGWNAGYTTISFSNNWKDCSSGSIPEITSSTSIKIFKAESYIAEKLRKISLKYEDIQIGSYPFKENGKIGVEILVRHTDKEYVQKVIKEIETNLNEP